MIFPPAGWHGYQRRRGEIAKLLDGRCYSVEWLDAQIIAGHAKALANDGGVIVFEVRTYPMGAREVHGLVAAGDLEAILPLIGEAERWGKSNACQFATVSSREGWKRVLGAVGYELHQVEMRKELSDGA